jgi:hypothetical protein
LGTIGSMELYEPHGPFVAYLRIVPLG